MSLVLGLQGQSAVVVAADGVLLHHDIGVAYKRAGRKLLLAHFCVAEATKHDNRVSPPVYLAVANSSGAMCWRATSCPNIVERSQHIVTVIRPNFAPGALPSHRNYCPQRGNTHQ